MEDRVGDKLTGDEHRIVACPADVLAAIQCIAHSRRRSRITRQGDAEGSRRGLPHYSGVPHAIPGKPRRSHRISRLRRQRGSGRASGEPGEELGEAPGCGNRRPRRAGGESALLNRQPTLEVGRQHFRPRAARPLEGVGNGLAMIDGVDVSCSRSAAASHLLDTAVRSSLDIRDAAAATFGLACGLPERHRSKPGATEGGREIALTGGGLVPYRLSGRGPIHQMKPISEKFAWPIGSNSCSLWCEEL